VILLDVVMPGMDGFETARDIKRRKKTRDVPIIFLTAVNSDPDYAFRGYAAGAVDFIAKPFDPWVLRAKVSVFVDLHNKNRQLRDQSVLLREQALLLRTQLTGPSGVPADLLPAIERQVAAVASEASAGQAPAIEELERLVAELRAGLDR
jgi:DNA-binding response OmpR family regulator